MAVENKISLAADGARSLVVFDTRNKTYAIVHVSPDTDSGGWGTAEVEIEGTVERPEDYWFVLPSGPILSTNHEAVKDVDVQGLDYIRLKTTTADGDADPEAIVIMRVY